MPLLELRDLAAPRLTTAGKFSYLWLIRALIRPKCEPFPTASLASTCTSTSEHSRCVVCVALDGAGVVVYLILLVKS